MKRTFCLLLIAILLPMFAACGNTGSQQSSNTLLFYYCADPMDYNSESGVIAPEERIYQGQENALEELLNLYLAGPLEKGYRSPFPDGLYAESVTRIDNRVQIKLSSIYSELQGLDLTLASVCLSKTVQQIAQVDYVYIHYEDSTTGKRNSIYIGPDSYILSDSIPESINTED